MSCSNLKNASLSLKRFQVQMRNIVAAQAAQIACLQQRSAEGAKRVQDAEERADELARDLRELQQRALSEQDGIQEMERQMVCTKFCVV